MFGLSRHQRFFLFSQAVDMRKGFDGLSGMVQQVAMAKSLCAAVTHMRLAQLMGVKSIIHIQRSPPGVGRYISQNNYG